MEFNDLLKFELIEAMRVHYAAPFITCELAFTFEGLIIRGLLSNRQHYFEEKTKGFLELDKVDLAQNASRIHGSDSGDKVTNAMKQYRRTVERELILSRGESQFDILFLKDVTFNGEAQSAHWYGPVANISSIIHVGAFRAS